MTDVSVTSLAVLKYRSECALWPAGSYGIAQLFLLHGPNSLIDEALFILLLCFFISFTSLSALFLPAFQWYLSIFPCCLSVYGSTHLFMQVKFFKKKVSRKVSEVKEWSHGVFIHNAGKLPVYELRMCTMKFCGCFCQKQATAHWFCCVANTNKAGH